MCGIKGYIITKLADAGIMDFYSGGADGVDCWAAMIVLELRKKNPALKLHLVLPHEGQESKWSDPAQDRYHSILDSMRTYIPDKHSLKGGILMEVISLHIGTISRREGRSSVQMAAYCSRSKMLDERTGKTYNYTKRSDLVHHEVMLPDHAPNTFLNSEVLWNSVEEVERSRNARLARVIIAALPKELDSKTHVAMAQQYAQEHFVQRGMCVDVSVHDKGDGNPHAHILLTTRPLDSVGRWMDKQHRNYLLDENGERIFDPVKRRYKLGRSIKTHDWDNPDRVQEWRAGWATACNAQFRQHGIDKEVTCLSYAKQGVDREPTKHLGAKVKAMEERGISTNRGNDNRRIIAERQRQDRQRFRQRMEQSRA